MLFLHVGLHKTATTFLQREVFPKFRGIEYIREATLDRILRTSDDRNYLFSNERLAGPMWGTLQERAHSIRRLSELLPEAKILVSFRRHDKYLESSYKGYLQNGGTLNFREYLDIDDDSGFMKKESGNFRIIIEMLEDCFGRSPFVFLQEEIQSDFEKLLQDMSAYLDAKAPELSEISSRRRNRGVGYYPARLLRLLNRVDRKRFSPDAPWHLTNRFTNTLRIDPRSICQKWLAFLPDKGLIPTETTQKIQDFYRTDWEFVVSYKENRQALLRGSAPTTVTSKSLVSEQLSVRTSGK